MRERKLTTKGTKVTKQSLERLGNAGCANPCPCVSAFVLFVPFVVNRSF